MKMFADLIEVSRDLKDGYMNIATLDKEYFRRKLRPNHKMTTGKLISKIQEDFHKIMAHMSIEDAHF